MLQVTTTRPLEEMEAALLMAGQHHGVSVLAVSHLGQLLKETAWGHTHDAIVFTICHSSLYAALLAADIRFAAFLPCRIAAIRQPEGVTLETISPRHICQLLSHSDLDRLAGPLETVLRELMEEAARPVPHARAAHHAVSGPGAVEGQMSMRAALPQRIDCRGTKIEDLAGTGTLDAPGG